MQLPPHRCQGCGALVSGPCPACAARHQRTADDRRRDPEKRALYKTHRWKRYARSFLAQHPLCGMRIDGQRHAEHSRCTRDGRHQLAEAVDHIVPTSRGGDHWDPENHQSLCRRCNGSKGNKDPSTY